MSGISNTSEVNVRQLAKSMAMTPRASVWQQLKYWVKIQKNIYKIQTNKNLWKGLMCSLFLSGFLCGNLGLRSESYPKVMMMFPWQPSLTHPFGDWFIYAQPLPNIDTQKMSHSLKVNYVGVDYESWLKKKKKKIFNLTGGHSLWPWSFAPSL